MNWNFPTLQQGLDQTAFDIQAPFLRQQMANKAMLVQDAKLNDMLAPPEIEQPGAPNRLIQQPPAFAQGGMIVPTAAQPSGPSLPQKKQRMTWNSARQRFEPMKEDAVGGDTNWDVANFGRYNGIGTSQGGIGRAQPAAPAMPAPVVPAAAPAMPALPAARMPGRGAGVIMPGPRKPAAPPLLQDFPGSGVLQPRSIARGPLRKAAMESAPPNLYQGFEPPAFAEGGMIVPGGKVIEADAEVVPFIVGDQPTGAMTSPNRVITSGQPNTITSRYGEASATRPEIVVTPSEVKVAGTNGPEMLTTTEPTVIMPNPQTVQENLQRMAAPPMPSGIGSNYRPNQPNLRWTGSGFASAPSGPRQTDLRRFMRSPQGVGFMLNQQADQQRMQSFMDRDDARFARAEQSQARSTEQAKLDKQAEDAAAEARMESMLDALSSEKTILQPAQRAALAKIKGTKEKQAALDAFMRMNEAAAEEQAKAKDKQAAGQITWEEVPGADYLVGKDATGRMVQTLPKAKPDAQPVQIPEGMEPVSMDNTGRVTYRRAATNTAPKVQTIKINGVEQSVVWNGTSYVPVPVGQAPGAPAAAAAPTASMDRYFKR